MQRAFKIYFAAVVMVLGGVSLLTNQKLYRFLVKPHFEFTVFPQFRSRLFGARSFTETADSLDDFETISYLEFLWTQIIDIIFVKSDD